MAASKKTKAPAAKPAAEAASAPGDGGTVRVIKDKTITIDLGDHHGQTMVSHAANQSGLRQVRARVIEVTKGKPAPGTEPDPEPSNVLPEDPFSGLALNGKIVEPPFDILTLTLLAEHNGELSQCIEAMEVNCESTGHRLMSRLKMDASGKPAGVDPNDAGQKQIRDAAEQERVRLVNFFTYATNEPWIAFRRRLRRDLELTGNLYVEVLRDVEGSIIGFTHIPAYQMRLGILDRDEMLVDRPVLELQVDGSVMARTRKEWRRFRPYVQTRAVYPASNLRFSSLGYRVRWFKEHRDPRVMDRETGEFATWSDGSMDPKGGKYPPLPEGRKPATEIIHLKLYSARTPYGLPRYIGNLLSIFGDRAAEEINYVTFRNNNIPSMLLMISNGVLTDGTIQRLTSFVESNVQGSDNMSKFVILEGEPFETDTGTDGGQVKIDAKELTKSQRTDELFTTYREKNAARIRRAFRLPPIFVGESADYSYSTIQASRSIGDEQVFGPERMLIDDMINRDIFAEMGVVFHRYQSNTPNTTDNMALVKIVAGAEKTGGMTPRIARQALEEILGQNLPPFPDDFPADVPFSLTMAQAVKNEADPAEPGQQVTALKALGILGDDLSLMIDDGDDNMAVAKKLLALNDTVTKMWTAQQRAAA